MSFFSPNARIYADWAATTPLHPRVAKAMALVRGMWANPSAIHAEGVKSKKALEERRLLCARVLGAKSEEVYFTSGGTESNATIIQGVLRTKLEKGEKDVHVVTTSIEHSSILETLRLFEGHGVKVTYVKPKEDGVVSADDVLSVVTAHTALVTVMYANNEIGTIQPVSKIGAGIRKIRAQKVGEKDMYFPVFHVDASQAPLWLSCDIEGMRADAMTLDAHKMQGPKGIGALIVRRHVHFEPLMVGGGQERGIRPSTESLELVAGFAEALSLAQAEREIKSKKAQKAQKYFFEQIEKEIPEAVVNGSIAKRLPNNVHISLEHIPDPEYAVLFLDKEKISCSTKSSCLKGEEESYVVKALGKEPWASRNTLRFTFAPDATVRDVYKIVEAIKRLPASPRLDGPRL